MELDWGDGDYGLTAAVLAPAAEALVAAAGVEAGDAVLDVACGTGNVARAAARRGARVTGVDASAGLIARARAEAEAGADVRFVVGDCAALPVPDAAADVALSAFGVIFAPDAGQALREMVRATRPGGTVALTSWRSEGPISRAGRVLREALPGGPPPGRWDDVAWLEAGFAAAGAGGFRAREAELVFRHDSPEAWLDEQEVHHPVWRFARRALGAGWPATREAMLRELRAGNDDPSAFAARSPYLIVRATRGGATSS